MSLIHLRAQPLLLLCPRTRVWIQRGVKFRDIDSNRARKAERQRDRDSWIDRHGATSHTFSLMVILLRLRKAVQTISAWLS